MTDYTEHIMKNWEWCEKYRSRLGVTHYNKYVNDVISLLWDMQPDTFFSIEKNVKPENLDLFIKVCCMFMHTQYNSQQHRDVCHGFNADCTEVRCISLHYSKNNNNKCNTVTI